MTFTHYCPANRGRLSLSCIVCGACSACGQGPVMTDYGKCLGCGNVIPNPFKRPPLRLRFMTADEFMVNYARRSGVTVEFLRKHEQTAEPCLCGEPGCKGWKMVGPNLPEPLPPGKH